MIKTHEIVRKTHCSFSKTHLQLKHTKIYLKKKFNIKTHEIISLYFVCFNVKLKMCFNIKKLLLKHTNVHIYVI